jgi:D-alanyl-D-alanine carboxypeptidase
MRFIRAFVTCLALSLSLIAAAVARPSIVVDVGAGTILSGEDIDQRWHPASLTKLMTALVVFEMLKRGDVTMKSPVKVSALALKQQPSKMS